MVPSNSNELTEAQFQEEFDRLKEAFSLQVEIALEKSPEESGCEVYWDEKNQQYVIRYNERKRNFGLIHELGHILLAELTGYRQFASLTISRVYSTLYPETENIVNCANTLIDSFANHQCFSAMEGNYPFLRDIIDWGLDQPFPERDFHEYLAIFLVFYLDAHYNLKAEDRQVRLPKINAFLSRLERGILERAQIDFPRLKGKLGKFNLIKSTINTKEILEFIYDILATLNLWDTAILREFFTHIFPVLPPDRQNLV